MEQFHDQLTPFHQRLKVAPDADERAIKRAYARELRLIDHEADVAGFQELRTAYEGALSGLRHLAQVELEGSQAESVPGGQPGAPPGTGKPAVVEAFWDGNDVQGDPVLLAHEVYSDLMQVCATLDCGDDAAGAWQRALHASLADERLINLAARQAFELIIADFVAQGWQPGNHLLFNAASHELEWTVDRRRVLGLGGAGYVIDAAIEQRALYESQSAEQYELQGKLLERLRDARAPSHAELIHAMPALTVMQQRFPTWLALATDAANVRRWHELDHAIPVWRRLRPPSGSKGWAIFIGIACVLFLLINAVSPGSRYLNGDRHLQAAKQLIEANNPEGALPHLDRAVQEAPNNPVALSIRALALVATGDFERARRDLDALEKLDSVHPDLYLGRGMIAMETGDYPVAIAAFSRSLERNPSNNYTRMARAFTYHTIGKPDLALADADAALEREPGRVGAYLLRAKIFHARGEAPKVFAEANAVVASNVDSEEAYRAAAQMHTLRRDRAAAMAVLAQGIQKAPSAGLYLLHAEGRDFTDFNGRRSDLDGAHELAPDAPEILLMQIQLGLDSGQYDAALAAATAALDKEAMREAMRHSRIILLASRGVAYEKQGKHDQAKNQFKTARVMASDAGQLNQLCWHMAINQASLPAALELCNLSLERQPDAAPTLDSKGFVLLQMKRYREALLVYDAAIKLLPNGPEQLYGRGIAKHRLGNARGGKADMDAALALRPELVEFFDRFKLLP